MKITVEPNAKHGSGLQLRISTQVAGSGKMVEQVIDICPYTSQKAAHLARMMTEIYNRQHGTSYTVEDVLEVSQGPQNGRDGVTPKKDPPENFCPDQKFTCHDRPM